MGQARMARLTQEGLLSSLAKVNLPICEPCFADKVCGKPFGKATRATEPLQVIYSDICRPMSVKVWYSYSNFLTFIDDFS